MGAHRYWLLNVTANGSDANVTNIAELVGAASAGGPNLLGGATITTSGQQAGWEATRIIDGSGSSMWASNSTAAFPKWVKFDFGATSANWPDIRELRMFCDLSWTAEAPKDFTWNYSDDNVTFTTVITVAGELSWIYGHTSYNGVIPHVFRTADCADTLPGFLYWRLLLPDYNNAGGIAIGEIEFRDTLGGVDRSLAYGAFGSPNDANGGNPFWHAFDNSSAGGWFSPGNPVPLPEFVGNLLDQRRTIREVAVTTYSGFNAYAPKSGTLQGSNDLATWTDAVAFTNQTAWANPETRIFNTPVPGTGRRRRLVNC